MQQHPKLSTGCIAHTMSDDPNTPFKVNSVVQVIGTKHVPATTNGHGQEGAPDRHRLAISDGTHVVNCLASTHVSTMIKQNLIPKFAIIQIENSIAQLISGRKIPVIVSCSVLEVAPDTIGNPVSWSWSDSSSNKAPITAAPNTMYPSNTNQTAYPYQQQQQQQQQASMFQSTDYAGNENSTYNANGPTPYNSNSIPAYNAPLPMNQGYNAPLNKNQGYNKPATTNQGYNTPASTNQAFNAPANTNQGYNAPANTNQGAAYGNNEMDHQVQSISSLTPYNNTWTIHGRLTSKGEIKTFTRKDQREGKLFSFVLMDESMDIRITCFDEVVDTIYNRAIQGRTYALSNGKLRQANSKYNSTQCDYEITAEKETRFEEISGNQVKDIPAIRIQPVPLADLMSVSKDGACDIAGIIMQIGQVSSITSKATNRELSKRELTLVDKSGFSVQLTIWGSQAEKFEGQIGQVMAIRSARVSDFNGRSLSVGINSTVMLNPDIPEAHSLLGWYQSSSKPSTWQSHSRTMSGGVDGSGNDNGSMRNVIVPLCGVSDPDLGGGKGEYYSSLVQITYVRNGTLTYPACPDCLKKVLMTGPSAWQCEKCNKSHIQPQYRYIATVCGADESGQQWFQVFDDIGRIIFNMDGDRFMYLREHKPNEAQAALDAVLYKLFRVRVRVKQDNYMGESRARHSIIEAVPICSGVEYVKCAGLALSMIQEYNQQPIIGVP